MEELTDLELIRKRPAMYVGDTSIGGLQHLVVELLDNTIDQYLAGKATFFRVEIDGAFLKISDDGPGLPFDIPHTPTQSFATQFLTQLRWNTPTADGHVPHVHLLGWGCGLCIVTALTKTCEVTSWRNGERWRQTFTTGIPGKPTKVIDQPVCRGTTFLLEVDRDVFDADWSSEQIEELLTQTAYLVPGMRVETPTMNFSANRGLADLAKKLAIEVGATNANRVWWFNESIGDLHIQAALAGQTDGDTQWSSYANGNRTINHGTHLTALKRVVSNCNLNPAVGLIQVIMQSPRFAGPTRNKLDAPEILSPIYQALKPDLIRFLETSK